MEVNDLIESMITDLKGQLGSVIEVNTQLKQELREARAKQEKYDKETSCLLFKIQQVKQVLNNQHLKKSGKNSFQNYNYYELEDINKPICDALCSLKLSSLFTFTEESAYLRLVDSESGAYMEWSTPLKSSERYLSQYKTSNKRGDVGELMKDSQALQTYARRSLYLQALEIAEPNVIEQTPQKNGDVDGGSEMEIPDTQLFNQIKSDFKKNNVDLTEKHIQNKLRSMVQNGKISSDEYKEATVLLKGGKK